MGFDVVICKSPEKNNGIEEGLKFILIILEYLSEFYKYINNNFDQFINYKNEISISELSDLVLLEKKYAIFSFWDDANLLMNKIFLNNESYLDWFFDSEKYLQKIMPSSPHFKRNDKKFLYPLYNTQIMTMKNSNEYNYKTSFGQNLTLNKICHSTDYDENRNILISNTKLPIYIISYFVDYFFALGGFNTLFSLTKNFSNIYIYINILENISLASEFTENFKGKFDEEKNNVKNIIMKFMEELDEKNYNKYSKDLVVKLFKKGSNLFPNKDIKNNIIFEELYLKYILKLFIFNKNENKKNEILNDIINILNSIEYNISLNQNNFGGEGGEGGKFEKRDKNIKDMTFFTFCVNIKNNKIIESIFNSKNIDEDIFEKILPLLIIIYKNNFGFEQPEKNMKEIISLKNLIFNKILSKIKTEERNNINSFKKLLKFLCDFCEAFNDEDKYFIFSELKTNFYNAKYNQNISFKQFFNFMIDYTCISVKKINKEKKGDLQSKNNLINFEEKKFYGLELIYEFLLNEQYTHTEFNYNEKQKKEMINTSIDGIIKIISFCIEQKTAIFIILNKINNAIKKQKDILQHLLLLQKLVINYNTDNDSNNIKILDENIKKINLFLLLISELKEYLSKIKKNKNNIIDINSIDDSNTHNNNNLDENSKENIKIRIETIFSLIPNYTRNTFDFKLVKEFIQLITQYDEYSREICFEGLLNNINNFSKDFLFFINSDIISKKDIFDIRNIKAYQIYKKIILKINMINNNHFLYLNNDIILELNEGKEIDTEIKGIQPLWDLILNDDQNIDSNIINDITDFICDIFFGVRIKTEKNLINAYKTFYEDFINNLTQKLNSILISKKSKKNIKAIKSLVLLIKKIINKTKNINGEIIKNIIKDLLLSNNLNDDNAVEFSFFGKKALSDSLYFCDLKLRKDECFHTLRYTLSSLYKIPVNQICISVYMNNLGKSELNQKNLEKIMKASPLKQFYLINDFDNIYQHIKGSLEFGQNKKKSTLLIHVTRINNIWEEIFEINIVNIIYNNSKIPLMFLSLLKIKEEKYLYDIINIIKDDQDLFNKAIIIEIEKEIKNKNIQDLFTIENTSIYYINFVLENLCEFINKNYRSFIKSNLLNNYILKLNLINDNEYIFNIKEKLPSLDTIYQKYKACNNLIKIYKSICINERDENLFNLIVFKLLNIYYYVINDSIYINLTKCESSKLIKINDIKNLFDEILNSINEIIINIERIKLSMINSLTNKKNNNIYLNKIKNIFTYISFDSIIKNKYTFINKRIKSLIIELITKYNNNNSFFEYLYEFYLKENAFNKLINIYKEINKENNNIINIKRYEQNTKNFFDICSQILLIICGNIKDHLNLNDYINTTLLPKIFNYPQFIKQNFSGYTIFPQFIFGGGCKLYNTILIINDIPFNEKKNCEFIFDNILMPNIKENILTANDIINMDKNKENDNFYISSYFAIKEASNLFMSFLFKKNNNNGYMDYLNILNKYHNLTNWKGNLLSDWKLFYKTEEKTSDFIGLKNLGSTCYINTVLQIFNNIPLLRDSLLSCDTPFSGGKNCLYQLKKVFYSLRYLKTNYYTPSSFIENFDEKKKIDPKIQMDVFEFLCDLLDKIEKKLKNSQNENLIKYFFMGIQNDILTFDKPCQHSRINHSNFYTIQLQVQDKFNLYQSLDTFIEGEKMDGENCIFCDKCNKKLPAVKSQNFQELPRILIFVLKRFEFNYNTMQKYKINDYYEFPLELDMNKYVRQNQGNNIYKLKSIIIHSGTCESGHYYCYINNNQNEWYEFNDIKVTKFDINNLDKEAFGQNDSNKNAYMLFYEKVDFYSGINFNNIKAINDLRPNIEEENDDEFNLLSDDLDEKKGKIKTEYFSKIITEKIKSEEFNDILKPMNKEMYEYFLYKRLFSGEYHHFVLSLFINILNIYKISCNNKLSFNYDLCLNNNNYVFGNEIKDFRYDRKNLAISNINNYLSRNKIVLINKSENYNQIENKEDEEKILELFKLLIIYFFNVMIRSREKDYLGGTVDLIKYFINNYIYCADYLIEEFANHNVLTEYMINCPSYEMKKLIVGIIYCAMINCVKTYENKMRAELQNKKNKKTKTKKEEKNKPKEIKENKDNNIETEQTMTDEEFARKLQEEENRKYSQQSWQNYDEENDYNEYSNNNNKNNNNMIEEDSNPLEKKYIPVNVLKLIYNIFYLIDLISYKNMNESRFLYLILYRFSTISNKCKKFLLNKALVLEFLNILLYSEITQENHNQKKITKSMNKGLFKSTHSILNKNNKEIKAIYDKGGAFHYENYITDLYYYLLSHNQKAKAKRPYFEGSYNFDNQFFIQALFFRINTKLDANIFSYLIIQKCKDIKTYKDRIKNIIENLGNILSKADFNENINYDVNSNRDVYNHNIYNTNNININNVDYLNEIPKINPKYILLIIKKFLLTSSENKKIDEFRINQILTKFFSIVEENQKYYNISILLIDFITELFINNISKLYQYIPQFSSQIKNLIDWIRLNPISPELYPIEGLFMYKSDNVVYNNNISEEEKKIFNEKNMKKAELRTNKLLKILEYKNNKFEKDFTYEALLDFSDFKFRKGDLIYYNKKKAVIKEFLDELILIKIIDKEKNNKNYKDFDEAGHNIDDIEKIKFWVAKDDKNISVYSLE